MEALNLFFDMLVVGFVPDKATFLSVIGACESVIILGLQHWDKVFMLTYKKQIMVQIFLLGQRWTCIPKLEMQ